MAGRGGGYISTLRGCWGWGQDSDREKTLDGFGSFGGRYHNTKLDGQFHPLVDPELSDQPDQPPTTAIGRGRELGRALLRRGSSGFIPPSRRGGPNEGYLCQADSQYHYFEEEGFWDCHGDYHFLRELGFFGDDGIFNIYNERAELFGLGYFDDDDAFYFYEEEIDRVDLYRLVQNAQAGREGPAEHGEEENARAGGDTNRHEENGACTNRTREEEENARVDTARAEEEINTRDEYRKGGENHGCAENSDGDGDDQIKLPCIFPIIVETREPIAFKMCESPDQINEEEEQEQQYCTPPRPIKAGPLQRPASYKSAPPGQIHVLCNKFNSVSLNANTTPRKHSGDFRVRAASCRINGSGPAMARPDRLEQKHNTPEMFLRDKIFGLVAPPNFFRIFRCVGARKPETNPGSPSPHVTSVQKRSQSRARLPERYRAQKTGDPFVDEVVAQEMADWAREEREEAEAKKKKKKDMANPRHP